MCMSIAHWSREEIGCKNDVKYLGTIRLIKLLLKLKLLLKPHQR